MQNVAIFGGTFNPVHVGHLVIAAIALEQFGLDQVIWVPTYQPPHKTDHLPDFDHRLEMVRLAISHQVKFTVSDIEAQHAGVSYAITTLTDLQSFYPDANWYWIIGSDAFQTLPKWRGSNILARECTWLVAPRSTTSTKGQDGETQPAIIDLITGRQQPDPTVDRKLALSSKLCQTVVTATDHRSIQLRYSLLTIPPINISSSLVRLTNRSGHDITALVPESVSCYIAKHKLYAK